MASAIDASPDPRETERQSTGSPEGSARRADIYSIGWWIESADDDVYGPASRATLGRLLHRGVISPNTLVRHCTEPTKRPVIDVPGVREGLPTGASLLAHGDKLSEAWPRRKAERLALAQDSIPCAWKKRPAVLVCLRCGAPYCEKYRAKPWKRQFYFCRRCQSQVCNRRAFAFLLDAFLLYLLCIIAPIALLGLLGAMGVVGPRSPIALIVAYGASFTYLLVFLFRDRLGGLGKKAFSLRVVRATDGHSPLTYGQAFVRWLSMMIPIFVLFDCSVPFRDPLLRRYGDRWAGTRVIDTDRKVSQLRQRIVDRLFKKKGVQLSNPIQTPMSAFARIVE
jgi:uncharacterized RDD family membrane protein YckC